MGVGSMRADIKHVVQVQIQSKWDRNFILPIQAYVMAKQLTTKIPTRTIPRRDWQHIKGLNLADPTYLKPENIDLLLGVKEYSQILQQDLIKGPPGSPSAQKTSLGWILFGEIDTDSEEHLVVLHHQVDVEDLLNSIWEKEEIQKETLQETKTYAKIYMRKLLLEM